MYTDGKNIYLANEAKKSGYEGAIAKLVGDFIMKFFFRKVTTA